jgi:hypothetical protein
MDTQICKLIIYFKGKLQLISIVLTKDARSGRSGHLNQLNQKPT